MRPSLTLDKVKNPSHNANMIAILAHPDTNQVWSSPISADFSVGTSSSYNTPLADLLSGANDVYQKAKMVAGTVDSSMGTNLSSLAPVPSLLTPAHSIMTWSNSERPQFQFVFTFVATSDDDDVQAKAVSLAAMTLPSLDHEAFQTIGLPIMKAVESSVNWVGSKFGKEDVIKIGDKPTPITGLLKAPAGYAPKGNDAVGTFTLSIGNWFSASKLILQDCQIEISKERFISGKAVWATATVTLVPFRNPTHAEFKSWFKASTLDLASATGVLTSLSDSVGGVIDKAKGFANDISSKFGGGKIF